MQTHQRTWWTVENFAFLRRNDFLDEKTTTRNWEHLCHQRKNAVNNWTIIDRQPFEYEAVCNVAVEGKLQNASVTWLSNACAFPFVPITACCVLTLQESAGSTAGSLGLSASIILHIRHIMKKEQSERSLSIYFLQHPSLSTPLTSPWQTAQPAAIPQTADTQRRANIPSQLTNSSDPLPWAMILSSFPAGKSHADTPATLSHLAGSHPFCSSEPQKPFSAAAAPRADCTETQAQEIWGTPEATVQLCLHQPPLFVPRKQRPSPVYEVCSRSTYLCTSSMLLPGTTSAARHKLRCHASWSRRTGARISGPLPGQKGKIKVINLVVISWLVAQICTCYFAQSA